MSIPPLVCSTPPPPDQCDDDKDSEDFDIRYNLSQEDDDDLTEYNYGNFTSYNTIATASESNIEEEESKMKDHIHKINAPSSTLNNSEMEEICMKNNNNNTLKSEEEIIEDLDLQIDSVSISNENLSQLIDSEDHTENASQEISLELVHSKDDIFEIPLKLSPSDCPQDPKLVIYSLESCLEPKSESPCKNSCLVTQTTSYDDAEALCSASSTHTEISHQATTLKDNIHIIQEIEHNENIHNIECDKELLKCHDNANIEESNQDFSYCENISQARPEETDLKYCFDNNKDSKITEVDDDFEDFDDFQCVSIQTTVDKIDECDNPWGDGVENTSNFKASFDTIVDSGDENQNITFHDKKSDTKEDDDEFGDFDDFKSSGTNTELATQSECIQENSQFCVNDDESVENVLNSIYKDDTSETETTFEGNLDSFLCETWRHLKDIEVRQPYMVVWNNSLGQNTLLKALCIDSRNILYGPNWAHNMPKYAANLTAAPLQPQKKPTSQFIQNETFSADRTTSKPNEANGQWSDPFISDGKEFTYAEALLLDLEHLMATLDQMAHNHSTLKISDLLSHACNAENPTPSESPPRPPDLSIFEPAIPEKIFSSTLGVQPLRQINLPDTHIFTPTDSEIPRSKTIHYSSGSSVLTPSTLSNENEGDYADFQNFQETVILSKPTIDSSQTLKVEINLENKVSSSNVPFQTCILEPIKAELVTPTLNWPDPGHVMETFEDFSDFISSSTNPDDNPAVDKQIHTDANPRDTSNQIASSFNTFTQQNVDNGNQLPAEVAVTPSTSYDDDFDTFQSAVPVSKELQDCEPTSISFPEDVKAKPDFNIPFANFSNKLDTEVKSMPCTTLSEYKTETTSIHNVSDVFPSSHSIANSSLHSTRPTENPVLQPIPAISYQNKQSTNQILQPLSLEGYSQINWPNPGSLDLQDLSRFNPVETLPSLKSDLSTGGQSKGASPAHSNKSKVSDDDIWGEFVSSKPKPTVQTKVQAIADDDEWTDFISSPVQPQNGLNTISLNVHTNSNIQMAANNTKYNRGTNQIPLDIPSLNYVTPKTTNHRQYNDRHFQNL